MVHPVHIRQHTGADMGYPQVPAVLFRYRNRSGSGAHCGPVSDRLLRLDGRSIRSYLWYPDGLCHAVPGFCDDSHLPSYINEGQVVCAHIRGYRAADGNNRHPGRSRAFRAPRRPCLRLPSHPLLEEETQTVQQRLTDTFSNHI